MDNIARFQNKLTKLFTGNNLKARAVRGSAWAIIDIVTAQSLRLLSNIILTRILFPEAFGLMALVQIFIAGISLFSDLGIHIAVIQNKRGDEEVYLNTAWTVQIIRGVALWIIACAIAWPASQLYNEPLLWQLLPVAGLNALIGGFRPTKVITARRHLLIGRLTTLNIISQIVTIAIIIALALALQSVWALVIGGAVGEIIKVLLQNKFLTGIRNKLTWDITIVKQLINFGKWIFLSTACGFILSQGDRAILGKFISLHDLGIYNIGYFLAMAPLMVGTALSGKIVFPLYRERPPKLSEQNKHAIFRARFIVTGFLFVLNSIFSIGGVLIVGFLYDPRYNIAGPIVIILSISLAPKIITSTYGSILLAEGDSRRYMMLIASSAIVQTVLLFWGISTYGILGAIVTPGITAFLIYPINARFAHMYGAWDPRHDIFFLIVSLTIATTALWANQIPVVQFIHDI